MGDGVVCLLVLLLAGVAVECLLDGLDELLGVDSISVDGVGL